jgi:hypothetical protein
LANDNNIVQGVRNVLLLTNLLDSFACGSQSDCSERIPKCGKPKSSETTTTTMPSIAAMKQLSAATGLVFGVFVTLHLATHYTLSVSWELAHSTQLAFRHFYQNPLVEVATFVSLVLHMYANTQVYLARTKASSSNINNKKGRNKSDNVPLELKGHRYAGYALALFVGGHSTATRFGPMFILEDPSVYDYSFAAKVMEFIPRWPFSIYLAVLGMAGGWHLIYGTRAAIATLRGSSVAGTTFPMPLKMVAMTSHLLVISAVLALNGVYYEVDTQAKEEFFQRLYSGMGMM